MKKYFYSSFAVLAAALIASSCAKDPVTAEPQDLLQVTIVAGNPEAQPTTKTEMSDTTPYWSVGDAIGVSDGESTNSKFTTAITTPSTTASFSGTAAVGDYYAYYPYSGAGVGTVGVNAGAKVDIPANQKPTTTSFDGVADVLISKKFTVSEADPTIDNLEFARLTAVVKLVLVDSENLLAGQHPASVSMTAESDLTGRVLVNLKEQRLEAPYYNASKVVTADYTAATKYEINSSNATYFSIVPQTLAEGTTLTIAASTEDYTITKDITVPAGGIALPAGKVTTLQIGLSSSNIVGSSGLELPFNDDFSWQTATGTTGVTFSSTPAIPSAKYSAAEKIYQGSAAGVIKYGTASATGYLTTVELDLSSAFYVHINAKNFNANTTTMAISVDDGTPVSVDLTSNYADYYVNFPAATKKSKVKIASSTGYRSFVQQLDIEKGEHTSPVINVTSANPMDIENTAGSHTITYAIVNPTAATLTASSSDAWISNVNYSTAGEVSFDVSAQDSGAAARSGSITLSYTGATDVVVTVNQAAGPGSANKFTISSATVVSGSRYDTYELEDDGDSRSWLITFGGNNKSVGTNSSNRSKCNLSAHDKYAVSPVTTASVAAVFANTSEIENIKQIKYTYNGGSNPTATKVYLLYSSDNTTFSQMTLTGGEQGAAIVSETTFEFAKCTGYFAVLFEATNTSGNWRIDEVELEFTVDE